MTENKQVRVRFAPSPTGGLHLGGVRTVLYNYLFAKKQHGQFILRIEDTDQTRFVEGAEQYIYDCLKWCGMEPDESPLHGGAYGPYRQSERKPMYREYAEKLIEQRHAYYAFDTSEELDKMRTAFRSETNPSPQYDASVRMRMKNSLTLSQEEVESLLQSGTPHVIRIKMPTDEVIQFNDLIHHEVSFDSNVVDDKVLLKADGMPTYHLAVVVDDYLMKITHAFRGEEWLSSAPVHIMLWKYLFGLEHMPQWAHLPLILGPEGKLSKRDGAKFGFPVYAMNWTDPRNSEFTEGFREKGFLPEAFVNLLAMLGWNSGKEQELFSLTELIQEFSIERVHKSGAKFDYEKARWFNHEWIKKSTAEFLLEDVEKVLYSKGIQTPDQTYTLKVIELVKERCTLLSDFYEQSAYFYQVPEKLDLEAIVPKWNELKTDFFHRFIEQINGLTEWNASSLETCFKNLASEMNIKPGELQLPMRIMLVGGKFGPAVFEIAAMIGKESTLSRIQSALSKIGTT
ncbi:MAG: glutamate--tRNA ligase [Ferruginibacter sp.]